MHIRELVDSVCRDGTGAPIYVKVNISFSKNVQECRDDSAKNHGN